MEENGIYTAIKLPECDYLWLHVQASVTHEDMRGADAQVCEIVILDDGDAGTLSFEVPSYSVGEEEGSIAVGVVRQGGSSSAVSVAVRLSNDKSGLPCSAEEADLSSFAFDEQSLTWADGESGVKFVTVEIFDDGLTKDRAFALELADASGGVAAWAGLLNTTTVTLKGSSTLSDEAIAAVSTSLVAIAALVILAMVRIRRSSSAKVDVAVVQVVAVQQLATLRHDLIHHLLRSK